MDVHEHISETCTKFSINRLKHQFSCVVQNKHYKQNQNYLLSVIARKITYPDLSNR